MINYEGMSGKANMVEIDPPLPNDPFSRGIRNLASWIEERLQKPEEISTLTVAELQQPWRIALELHASVFLKNFQDDGLAERVIELLNLMEFQPESKSKNPNSFLLLIPGDTANRSLFKDTVEVFIQIYVRKRIQEQYVRLFGDDLDRINKELNGSFAQVQYKILNEPGERIVIVVRYEEYAHITQRKRNR